MFRLDGKTIVVIGAASGIGEMVAMGVAEQGGHVICLDLNGDGAAARRRASRRRACRPTRPPSISPA